MSKEVRHGGTRRFWSGKVDTWCGLVLDNAERVWWSSPTCPACKRAKKSGRGRA